MIKKNTETCKNNLKQHHACEGKFCASDLKIASLNSLGPSYGAVFACDFCKLIVSLEENMKKHLKEHEHYSASEYFFSKNDENRQLTFLKSRSSVKNFAQISKFRVFCPQCNDNFDCDTLACSKSLLNNLTYLSVLAYMTNMPFFEIRPYRKPPKDTILRINF